MRTTINDNYNMNINEAETYISGIIDSAIIHQLGTAIATHLDKHVGTDQEGSIEESITQASLKIRLTTKKIAIFSENKDKPGEFSILFYTDNGERQHSFIGTFVTIVLGTMSILNEEERENLLTTIEFQKNKSNINHKINGTNITSRAKY